MTTSSLAHATCAVLALAGGVLAASCAGGTARAQALPIQLASDLATSSDPPLAPPPKATRLLHSWRAAFEQLSSLGTDYAIAADNVERAHALGRVALAAVLPTLSAQAGFTHQLFTTTQTLEEGSPITIPAQDVWSASANLTVPVGNLRAWHGIGTARRALAAAREDFREVRRMLALQLVDAVTLALTSERLAELDRSALRSGLQRVELTRAKLQLGGGTELDVDRALQELAATRASVVLADEMLVKAHNALGLLLGATGSMAPASDLNASGFEITVAGFCRLNRAVEDQPEVAAAQIRVELADRALEDSDLQYVPALQLGSRLSWDSRVLYGPKSLWNLQAQLSVPLWEGGARYGQRKALRRARDSAMRVLTAIRRKTLVELSETRMVAASRATLLDMLREQRERAQSVDEKTRSAYAQGFGTSLELITSAQALRQAETSLAISELEGLRARLKALLVNADCIY